MTEKEFEKLASLLDHLHECMGLKFALMNSKAEEIYTSSAQTRFCTCIKTTQNGIKRCVDCDRRALRELTVHDKYMKYRCHCGLVEVALPVVENGEKIATILFGQFLDSSPREEQWKHTVSLLDWFEDPEELQEAFYRLRQMSSPQLFSLLEIIHACISEVRLQGLLTSSGVSSSAHLQNYISQHYPEKIGLEELCREMHMGKSSLFELCHREFSKTPGQMILEARMHAGRELLEMTELSVSQVAQTVGIHDAAYFGKCFRKTYGIAPLECRRK